MISHPRTWIFGPCQRLPPWRCCAAVSTLWSAWPAMYRQHHPLEALAYPWHRGAHDWDTPLAPIMQTRKRTKVCNRMASDQLTEKLSTAYNSWRHRSVRLRPIHMSHPPCKSLAPTRSLYTYNMALLLENSIRSVLHPFQPKTTYSECINTALCQRQCILQHHVISLAWPSRIALSPSPHATCIDCSSRAYASPWKPWKTSPGRTHVSAKWEACRRSS